MKFEVKSNSSKTQKFTNNYFPTRVFTVTDHYHCMGERCGLYRSSGGTVWCTNYYAGKCMYPEHAKLREKEEEK